MTGDRYIDEAYKLIKGSTVKKQIAGDTVLQVPASTVEELQLLQYEHTKARYIEHYGSFHTLQDAYNDVKMKLVGDGFDLHMHQPSDGVTDTGVHNNTWKIGTLADPSMYTYSNVPVMVGPYEGSALYSSGGMPAAIIDKKSQAMALQGATFTSQDDEFWTPDKIHELENAAISTKFNEAIGDAICQTFIYGGAIIYPVFTTDTPSVSYRRHIDKMNLEPECIDRWVVVDRWNTMLVPNYTVTAKDYLHPDSLFIPQSGLEINTSRIAMLKAKPMPYWVTLFNLGWAPADYCGWIRSYYAYKITMQSIPVMAQQMSLLLYKMPLDGLNATVGPEAVRKLMAINEEKMAEWSALNPKAVNMIGEVEVVNRSYSGFDQFIGAMKSDLASQCGIPEPVLWHTPNKGFSDNTTESLLKQSETIQMLQAFVERSLHTCTDALIAHVYGTGSQEWENKHLLHMTFARPELSTEKDKAESGARFAASIASLSQAGVPPDIATKICTQFYPNLEVGDDVLKEMKTAYDETQKQQMEMQKMSLQAGGVKQTGANGTAKNAPQSAKKSLKQ